MKEFLKELFEYSQAHELLLLSQFEKHPHLHEEKPGSLFDHILNAHHIWNFRMLGKERRFEVWQRHKLSALHHLIGNNFSDSMKIIGDRSLDEVLDYRDTKGNKYSNTYKEILFHIVNHGTYHRGQLALEMRNRGLDPIISDYIYYKREMKQ